MCLFLTLTIACMCMRDYMRIWITFYFAGYYDYLWRYQLEIIWERNSEMDAEN